MHLTVVILGSFANVQAQTSAVRDLVGEHGFEALVNRSMSSWGWIEKDSQAFVCNHVDVVGSGDIDGFLVESLKLSGVYLECPECKKHHRIRRLCPLIIAAIIMNVHTVQ
jgi:hypothetical protein